MNLLEDFQGSLVRPSDKDSVRVRTKGWLKAVESKTDPVGRSARAG
jgi:hypothetical protein